MLQEGDKVGDIIMHIRKTAKHCIRSRNKRLKNHNFCFLMKADMFAQQIWLLKTFIVDTNNIKFDYSYDWMGKITIYIALFSFNKQSPMSLSLSLNVKLDYGYDWMGEITIILVYFPSTNNLLCLSLSLPSSSFFSSQMGEITITLLYFPSTNNLHLSLSLST